MRTGNQINVYEPSLTVKPITYGKKKKKGDANAHREFLKKRAKGVYKVRPMYLVR